MVGQIVLLRATVRDCCSVRESAATKTVRRNMKLRGAMKKQAKAPQPKHAGSQGMNARNRNPWVPFFTIFINLALTMEVDPFCGRKMRASLFSGFALLFLMLWRLPTRPSAFYDGFLTSLSLFVVPLCALLPWHWQQPFRCILKSWTSLHAMVLFMSQCIIVAIYCRREREPIKFAKEPGREPEPNEPETSSEMSSETSPRSSKKESVRSAPHKALSPLQWKAQTPRKLASDSQQRWSPHVASKFSAEGLAAQLEESSRIHLSAATALKQPSSYKHVPQAIVPITTQPVQSQLAGGNALAEQAVLTLFTGSHIRMSLKKPGGGSGGGSSSSSTYGADAFWKEHSLWDKSVSDAKDRENPCFDDGFGTTKKPHNEDSIKNWVQNSCEGKITWKDQHVLALITDKVKAQEILKEGEKLFEEKSVGEQFYWLILRLVYASSTLKNPADAWWYQREPPTESVQRDAAHDVAPDNFCLVLLDIFDIHIQNGMDREKWVFSRFNDYKRLIFHYVQGLKSMANQFAEKRVDMLKRLHWIRSRPHLGLWDFTIQDEVYRTELKRWLSNGKAVAKKEADSVCIGDPNEETKESLPKAMVGSSSNSFVQIGSARQLHKHALHYICVCRVQLFSLSF